MLNYQRVVILVKFTGCKVVKHNKWSAICLKNAVMVVVIYFCRYVGTIVNIYIYIEDLVAIALITDFNQFDMNKAKSWLS